MKNSLCLIAAFSLSGCGIECTLWTLDQPMAECVSKYGSDSLITCYSEGKPVFREISKGEPLHGRNGRMLFLVKRTGKAANVYGTCTSEKAP